MSAVSSQNSKLRELLKRGEVEPPPAKEDKKAAERQKKKDLKAIANSFREHWEVPSDSSDKVYTVLRHFDGHLSCDCRASINKVGGTRYCKHIKRVVRDHNLTIMEMDPNGYPKTFLG